MQATYYCKKVRYKKNKPMTDKNPKNSTLDSVKVPKALGYNTLSPARKPTIITINEQILFPIFTK